MMITVTKTELWIATMTILLHLAILVVIAIGCTEKKKTQAEIEAENKQFHENLIKFKDEKIQEIKEAGVK